MREGTARRTGLDIGVREDTSLVNGLYLGVDVRLRTRNWNVWRGGGGIEESTELCGRRIVWEGFYFTKC